MYASLFKTGQAQGAVPTGYLASEASAFLFMPQEPHPALALLLVGLLLFLPQLQLPPVLQLPPPHLPQPPPAAPQLPQPRRLFFDSSISTGARTGTWMMTPLSSITSTDSFGTLIETTLPRPLGVSSIVPTCGIFCFA
jgi:hypothetical protein